MKPKACKMCGVKHKPINVKKIMDAAKKAVKPNVAITGSKKDNYIIDIGDQTFSSATLVTFDDLVEINALSSDIINKEYNKL